MKSAPPHRAPRRVSLCRRFWRWTVYCVLVGGLLLGLAFALQRPILRRWVLPRLEGELARVLGLTATLGDVHLGLDGVIVLEDIALGNLALASDKPLTGVQRAGVQRIEVVVALWKLLRGQPGVLEKVTIQAPSLDLHLGQEPMLPTLRAVEPASEPSPAPGRFELPEILIAAGEFVFRTDVDVVRLHGVDVQIQGRTLRARIEAADGNWTPPRLSALRFPLEVQVELEGNAAVSAVRVHRLLLDGREQARDVRIDLELPGTIGLTGEFPGWGARLVAGSLRDNVLDLDIAAENADLRAIVSLFTDWPVPEASARGRFRLILPLERLAHWQAHAELELEDVSWPEQALAASLARVSARRDGPGLVLGGDVFLGDVRWDPASELGVAACDAMVRFRRFGEPGAERIFVDEATLHGPAGSVDASGVLREQGLVWEGAAIRTESLNPGAVSQSADAAGWRSRLGLQARLTGSLLDPASLQAALHLQFDHDAEGGTVSGEVAARLGNCVLNVDDGHVKAGEGEARFAATLSAGPEVFPVVLACERLQGSYGCLEATARIPPWVEIEKAGLRLRPSVFLLGDGALEVEALVDEHLQGFARVEVEGVDLASLPVLWPAEVAVQGRFSCHGEYASEELVPLRLVASGTDVILTSQGRQLAAIAATLRAHVTLQEIKITELHLVQQGSEARLTLAVPALWTPLPVPQYEAPFDARFSIDVRDVADFLPPVNEIRELGGRVLVGGQVRGKATMDLDVLRSSLDVQALVTLFDGKLKRWDETPPLTELHGELRVSGNTLSIVTVTGKIHDAGFTLEGEAAVEWPWDESRERVGAGVRLAQADLRLVSKSVLLVRRRDLRARGDLDLRLLMSAAAPPRLQGTLTVTRAYWLEAVSMVPSRGAKLPLRLFSLTSSPLDRLLLDVRIRSDRDIHLRNNVVATRASAELVLTGTGLEPVLIGTVSTDEGFVRLADSRLALRGSFIEFRRDDPLNPRLQIQIEETIRNHTISLVITGTLEAPEVLLDSSPPLEREKILVLITTGLTLDEIEEQGVSRVAAVKAAKYVGLRIARYFSRGDPTDEGLLDRFTLETESAKSARQEDPIRVEYRLIDKLFGKYGELFLQGERDTYSDYNFNIGVRFELD